MTEASVIDVFISVDHPISSTVERRLYDAGYVRISRLETFLDNALRILTRTDPHALVTSRENVLALARGRK